MTRIRWETIRVARALGLPGWAAVALLVLGVGWVLLDVMPTARRAEGLEQQALELVGQARQPRPNLPSPETAEARLDRLMQRFGDAESVGPAVRGLNAAALRQGVRLPQGDFRLVATVGDPVARYSMDLTLVADYRALRRFLRDALREQPALALESLSLQRAESLPGQVDARIRFVLFVQPASGARS